ncbi:MAG: D-amino-acid transaminase [Ignavibacteriales bacterium]|nr:MAG: D-amino-acid transaminase [Ignavibacteriales bacterium]
MKNDKEIYYYLNGNIIKGKELCLSPFDRAFLFGDGIYETLRWYDGKLFKLDLHIEKLKKSLDSSRINFIAFDEIEKIINDLIKKNKFEDEEHLFIYLQVTRGAYFPRQHHFPPDDVEPGFFLSVVPFKRHEEELKNGIKVILEEDIRWTRCDIKSTMLMANVLSRQKALEQNAVEAVFVRNGFITEGTHTSFCAVKSGKLYTPPLSNLILDGITRKVILEICKKEDIPVSETEIKADELKSFEEVMLLGTISEVMPVVQIDDWQVGDGKPGPVTLELQYLLGEMIFS